MKCPLHEAVQRANIYPKAGRHWRSQTRNRRAGTRKSTIVVMIGDGHDRRVEAELFCQQRQRASRRAWQGRPSRPSTAQTTSATDDTSPLSLFETAAWSTTHDLCRSRRRPGRRRRGPRRGFPSRRRVNMIAELDLVQADAADDRDARLRTGVAAGVHQHRDERRQAWEHASASSKL